MKDGEEFTGGKYYKYDHITFDYPEKDRWEFEESLFNLKVNGKNKEFIADFYYPGSYFILSLEYVVPATVDFDMNGFGVQVPSQSVMPAKCAEEPEAPSCTGYRFSGWYTTPELDEKFDFSTPLNDSITLYAGWMYPVESADVYFDLPWLHCKTGDSVNNVKASFDAPINSTPILWEKSNNGVDWNGMAAGEEFFADTYYRAKMTLKNSGEYFFTPSVKATVYGSSDGVEYTLNDDESLDITYTKYLERTAHTVSYDMNGHGTQVPDEVLEEGLTATRLQDPSEEGYAFDGWYIDSECKTPFDFNKQIVFDTTLYAKWRKVIHSVQITVPALFAGKTPPDTVTLSTEFGSDGLVINTYDIDWEKEDTNPIDYWHWFKKFEAGETYIINRVSISADSKDYLFADDLEITSSTGTVEILRRDERSAVVRIKVTIKSSGMLKPGEFDIAFNMMEHGEQIENIIVEAGGKAQKPADPSEENWTFNGWYTDAKLTEKFDFDSAITEDTMLYAKWTQNGTHPPVPTTYTVTFNMNGHGTQVADQTVEDGNKATKPADPTASGWTFGGWYADATFSAAFDFNTAINADTTIYAKWNTKNPSTGGVELPFADVKETDWSYEDIAYVYEKGLMQGTSATTFAPQLSTSRAMIVTILWRLEGAPVVNYAMSFTDVAPDQWYTEAIRWAQANGIVNGYSAEKFGINDPITREQMATILYRYAQAKGEGFTGSWMFLLDFDDRADISGWADEAMHWCVMKNIIGGVGNNLLDPQGRATREQIAAILHRFCENIVK